MLRQHVLFWKRRSKWVSFALRDRTTLALVGHPLDLNLDRLTRGLNWRSFVFRYASPRGAPNGSRSAHSSSASVQFDPGLERNETCSEIEQYVIHERRLGFRDPLAEVG